MERKTILRLDSIVKTFPGVRALDGVKLDIAEGEVHALCGENGAGKSTLMKIIAGAQPYTSGHMYINDEEVSFKNTREAEAKGIAMIYQEFNMINDFSVAENMYLGRLPMTNKAKVNWKKLYKEAQDELDSMGLRINAKSKVKNLSVAESQMVEIAKCLTIGAKIIIMDEPTAALADEEIKILFKIIEDLKKKGISIIYISHRMDEIFQISDRLTVFRDGKYVDTKEIKDTNYDEVVAMMVGRNVGQLYPVRNYKEEEVVFEVKNMKGHNVDDVSFQLHKGEILGITGLLGAGDIELSKMIYGAIPKDSGEVLINGEVKDCSSPRKALDAGIGFVSDDRKQEGLVLERSIRENISLASLKKICKGIHLNKKAEEKNIQSEIKALNIKLSSPEQLAGKLSGGNQQKVVFAKVLESDPDILILDEPTRGVDVGAKAEIYQIMDNLTKEGKSIVVISTDLPELIGVSDRAIVMRAGKIVKEFNKADMSQEAILAYASGGVETDEQ